MEDLPLNSMESDTYLKFEGAPALILHILGLFFFFDARSHKQQNPRRQDAATKII